MQGPLGSSPHHSLCSCCSLCLLFPPHLVHSAHSPFKMPVKHHHRGAASPTSALMALATVSNKEFVCKIEFSSVLNYNI